MKSKKSIYFLLPVAVIVWGIIAYKIISNLSNDNELQSPTMLPGNMNSSILEPDTFSLILSYRDPFLSKSTYSENTPLYPPQEDIPKKNITIAKEKRNIDWPIIKYLGIIKNKNNGNNVCLININNKDYLMFEGQENNGVKLSKIMKDSIRLLYQNESKTIIK